MRRHPPYSVHPGVAYQQALIGNLGARTGRSIDEWTEIVRAEAPSSGKEIVRWLQDHFGLGRTTASLIAAQACGVEREMSNAEAYLAAAPGYVDALYSGPRAALRPLHDLLVEVCLSMGADVTISPARTMVPVYRAHVIAQIRPSTRTRVDLGLALASGFLPDAGSPRLVETGGAAKGDRITHRVGLSTSNEVDGFVRRMLREAYEADVIR